MAVNARIEFLPTRLLFVWSQLSANLICLTARGCYAVSGPMSNVRFGSFATVLCFVYLDRFVPCVDGSELARAFFTFAALVGAAMCSAFKVRHTCLLYTSPSPRDRTRSRM